MTADVTVPAESVRRLRRRNLAFGLSVRILGMVIAAVMIAEILLFLPSIARFRVVYLDQLIESGTLAALALDATPDNMVTEEVKRALLNNARVDTVVLVEPNKPKRALMTIEPRATMPSYNLKEEGAATNKINHDLRNMLSTARLLSDRLARSDDERTRSLAPTILNTIDRAARLASDAIEYVRDRPTPRLANIDLADLVDEVGVVLQEQGEDSTPNIVRHWDNAVGADQPVRADRDLLYRVFVNLGRNAFEASATTVTVRARTSGGHLVIEVADDGPGVPQEVADQIFRPFTRGGRAG